MTTMHLPVLDSRPVLGSFGKGTAGSVALNYARSGGSNCSKVCPYHPETESPHAADIDARCYAARCEARPDRSQLAAKLDRHESAGGDEVSARAYAEARAHRFRFPWFRFSAFGSVPDTPPRDLVRMVEELASAGTPIHLPIEDPDRAARYRAALPDSVAVRLSVPIVDPEWMRSDGPVSTVAGSMDESPMDRLAAAKNAAARFMGATGRRAVVCPAVASTTYRRRGRNVAPVKCGDCTACADPTVGAVVYPAHS